MTKKAQTILRDAQKYFDDTTMNLSKEDYREVVEEMLSTLESYYDCLKAEMGEES